ncbi:PepSY domain-containing protein [Acutalibacter intestini]|uniref:PepSY domain-containing protein n=1 Tax=Acutalibacter intestini TaxID=3093659 RepID=UPI002AC986F1|nr:PepSY domain-containing protein [Acutalibacter sp. M00204]
MKKSSTLFPLLAALLCAVFLLGPCSAAFAVTSGQAALRPNMTIIIDGTKRSFFNVSGQQVHPILYQNTTYLPVRAIGELMGKNVDWNQSTKTVTLAGERLSSPVTGTLDANPAVQSVPVTVRDDFTVVVEGSVRTFQDAKGKTVYPLLYKGSTYLPLRAIGQLMGKTVQWDSATQTATLSQDDEVTDADSFGGVPGQPTPVPQPTATPKPQISAEEAKKAALAHAGLTADQVSFTKTKLDWDDGRWVYEVEFESSSYLEYEYEINAATGAVLSYQCEPCDHWNHQFGGQQPTPQPTAKPSQISAEEAKKAALAHAGLTASQVTFTKTELDRDDGLWVYEVEFESSSYLEYEYEINAATGAVLSHHYEHCDHWEHCDQWNNGGHHGGWHH